MSAKGRKKRALSQAEALAQVDTDEEGEVQVEMLQRLRALRGRDDPVVAAANLSLPPAVSPPSARRRRVLPTPPPGVQPTSFFPPVGGTVSPRVQRLLPSPPAADPAAQPAQPVSRAVVQDAYVGLG